MSRYIDLTLTFSTVRLLCLYASILALTGCAALGTAHRLPGDFEGTPKTAEFEVGPGVSVLGRAAVIRTNRGDTLHDLARHFGLGVTALSAANPGVDPWLPEAETLVTLPLSFILPDAPRKGIVVNLGAMRLFHFKGEGDPSRVATYPIGVGTEERPTPTGQTQVVRKAVRPTWHVPASIAADHRKKGDILPREVPPGPDNPLGEYALYLSKAGYLIHGTNKPASIGLKATNGCIRLYPEDVKQLHEDTPVHTPVAIVNQPYLIGERDGVLYLEAHAPLENPRDAATEMKKTLALLRDVERRSGRRLDWKKVEQVRAEARGIPVPISEVLEETAGEAGKPAKVAHPGKLYGSPEVPELRLDAWYVLAAELRDEKDARRMAAILNHQGPQIPARVVQRRNAYRVLAGPFNDLNVAKSTVKRLKLDLDLDGAIVEPVQSAVNPKAGGQSG